MIFNWMYFFNQLFLSYQSGRQWLTASIWNQLALGPKKQIFRECFRPLFAWSFLEISFNDDNTERGQLLLLFGSSASFVEEFSRELCDLWQTGCLHAPIKRSTVRWNISGGAKTLSVMCRQIDWVALLDWANFSKKSVGKKLIVKCDWQL